MMTSLGTGMQADSSSIRPNTAGAPLSPTTRVSQSTRVCSNSACGLRLADQVGAAARVERVRRGADPVDHEAAAVQVELVARLGQLCVLLLQPVALRRRNEQQVAALGGLA